MSERWVIWSFEHDAWWRPGRWGYTRELAEAGHYTKAEADAIVAQANIVAINEQALLLSDALRVGPPAYAGRAAGPPAAFKCPRCGAVSYNLNDIRERYCGACHVFVDDAR